MVSAIITAYHPSESVRLHVEGIAAQVDRVLICDNSSVSNQGFFESLCNQGKVEYIGFCENLGLSVAFNRVLKNKDFGWHADDYVFFFDQDSSVKAGHITQMIEDYENLLSLGYCVGCLGPAYFNTSNHSLELPKVKKPLCDGVYAVSSIITSSMLCRYGDLQSVGFWNEDIFLDMADWDVCWRLTSGGKLCCLTQNVVLHHSVGCGEKKIGPIRLRVGQPVREYYQIRDGMYLFTKTYAPWKFRVRYLAMLTIRSVLHVLLLDRRLDRLRFICKGFTDACRKKKGILDIFK